MEHTDSTRRAPRARLTRSGDFDAVYRRGRSAAGRHLVVYVFDRGDAIGSPRLGVSISKRVGGAVERNRLKRVLREGFAAVEADVPSGADVVVIARPGAVEYLDEMGSAALHDRLRDLITQLGGSTMGVAS